jgi:hypothetical protein
VLLTDFPVAMLRPIMRRLPVAAASAGSSGGRNGDRWRGAAGDVLGGLAAGDGAAASSPVTGLLYVRGTIGAPGMPATEVPPASRHARPPSGAVAERCCHHKPSHLHRGAAAAVSVVAVCAWGVAEAKSTRRTARSVVGAPRPQDVCLPVCQAAASRRPRATSRSTCTRRPSGRRGCLSVRRARRSTPRSACSSASTWCRRGRVTRATCALRGACRCCRSRRCAWRAAGLCSRRGPQPRWSAAVGVLTDRQAAGMHFGAPLSLEASQLCARVPQKDRLGAACASWSGDQRSHACSLMQAPRTRPLLPVSGLE